MSDSTPPADARKVVRPLSALRVSAPASEEKMTCERCGQAEMYRMHAVWRCPACGFKTDCCGW
jgi:ribosomal protein L37AE/L43A